MKNISILLCALLLLASAPCVVAAASGEQAGQGEGTSSSNLLFILDASGSMWGRVDGEPKIVVAKEVMASLVRGLPDDAKAGLIAYGHRRKGECTDIESLVALGPLDRDAMIRQVEGLNAKGMTPLTASVKQAIEQLRQTEQSTSVVLVSDGLESGGGDPGQAGGAAGRAGGIAYGPRRKGECTDIESLVALGPLDRDAMIRQVEGLNAKGMTPLTASVKQAIEQLRQTEQSTSVVLVSDGLESCGGDPCEAVRAARQSGVDFKLHVVGFDLGDTDTAPLQCMAAAGGGRFFRASNADEVAGLLRSEERRVG